MIFDIGANTGEYSKLLLKHTEATIYAFEPNPFSFKDLQQLPERVKKIQLALADTKGIAQLNFQSEQDEKASLDSRVRSGQTVDVGVTTIDSFVKENQITEVDFIKIDTEGFEREVLLGLGEVRPKFIQFEFNDHNIIRSVTLADLATLLPDYNLFRLLPSGWVRVDPKSYIDNIFIFSNYIAVRK